MKNTTLKRFLSLVLALTMVMSYAAVPAAATGDDPATEPSETTHQCSFTQETARTEATCGTAGSVTLACECTQTTTQEIPATGEHTYENGVCSVCQQNKPCSLSEGCDAPAHAEECPEKPQATQQEEIPVVCDGTETCAATSHETTCECYDPCIVLGCTEDAHHADCPYGPCTKTEGCELVKDHEGDCTGISTFEAFNNHKIKFGNHGFNTLAEAFTAVNAATGDVTVEIYDKVTLNSSLNGSYTSIKFVGKTDTAEIYLDVQGYIEAPGKTVAFENLKLSKSTGAFMNNAGFMNVAFGIYNVNAVTYTNCTFVNGAYASSGTVTFQNCTFYRSHDKYGLWAYGNVNCIVNGGKFDDYRGIKMYAENAAKTTKLTVNNADFSKVDNKPAIVLTYGESVTLSGNTYSDTGVFELDLDGQPNGTKVTSDITNIPCKNDNGACGVLVDDKIYTNLSAASTAIKPFSTVTLMYDTQETVDLPYGVTLTKNGYAAANVTVSALDTEEELTAAIEKESNISLGGNISLTETLTIPEGKTVTLDLNGKTISLETSDATAVKELIRNDGSLTIKATSGGKITFKHNAGSTGFAANTILNRGTLSINGGTIENTTGGQSICYAVDNNSTVGNVSVTVNGGTLDSSSSVYGDGIRQFANSTSANNSVTVTGGTVSSIWMQNPSDKSTNNTADVKASLSISGGTVNAVYIEPSTGFTVSIIGGTFKTVSASQNNADDRIPKNFITGGTFKDGETVTDVTAYLPIGYTQDSTGKVVEKNVTIQSTGTNVNVSATIPETDKEVSDNAATINNTVSVPTTDSKVQAAIAEIDGAAEATGVKVSLNLNITEYENTDGKITLTFDVAPHVQPVKVVDGTTTNVGDGVTLKEVENPITFRLPMPDGTEGKIASIIHVHNSSPSDPVNYVIQEEDGNCFVEITSKKFSNFIVSITSEEAVALLKSTNIAYSDLVAANDAATANETIVLLKDTTIASDKVLSITENVTLDLNGKTLTGTVVGTISMNGGTYYTYDSTTSDGKYKISAPTGSAYNSSNAVLAIATTGITIADGDVVLGWDMYTDANHTLTVSHGASFTIPAQKTLLLRKAAVVNGTLTVNGAFILEPNATVTVANNGQVNGTGSFELKTRATITGPANLNVITKVANSKVVYNSTTKVYSIAPDYAATVGTTGYYNLEEAINAATTSTTKTVTLEKDGVVNNNLEITGITIDMNNHVIKGTGSITSKGNVIIHKMGTAYSPVTITLETGDKAAFGTDGNVTITANPTNLHGYDSVKVTLIGSNGTSLSYYYFMRTGGDLKGSVTVKPTSEIITSGHVLSSSNTTPTYTVTAIKVNDKLGSSYTYGSTETITIESNGFHSCFSDVYVNGLKLATTAYEHKEGSTIITLKNSYLKTLSKGQYKVILTYADGNYSNEVSFYVVSAPKATWNPQTGDMILPAVFVMIAAAAGLGVLVYLGKKKKK